MAGKVLNIKVCRPLKLRSDMTGNYHAICHYLYNLLLSSIKMKERNIIYEKNKIDGFERLTIEGQILRYTKKDFQAIREIVTPVNQLKKEIQFDKSYHFILILISAICFTLSCLLLYKFFKTDDWRKILGLGTLILSVVGIFYYIIKERKYGITIIDCTDEIVKIRTKSNEYDKIRDSLINKLIAINGK